MLTNIAIVAAVIIVILILRSISEKRIGLPEAPWNGGPGPSPDGADPGPGLDPAGGFDAFGGKVGEVEYVADMYSDDAITVEIDLDDTPENAAEMDIRDGGALDLDPADPLRPEAEALIAMGANYIDVGLNADRVAAEFPASMKIDHAFAERAVQHLIRLKEAAG